MCCKAKYILQILKPATKIMYFNEKTEIISNFGRKSIAFIPLFSLDIWLLHSLCFLRLRILYTIIAIKNRRRRILRRRRYFVPIKESCERPD